MLLLLLLPSLHLLLLRLLVYMVLLCVGEEKGAALCLGQGF